MNQVVAYESPAFPVGNSFILQAEALEVDDQVTYDIAVGVAREFKQLAANWEAKRKTYADPVNKLKDQIQADFMPIINALKEAESVAKRKAVTYINEQAAIQRKAQAEAVSAADRAMVLSDSRYRNGAVSQLELLDSRRTSLTNRRVELQVKAAQFQATVALVKALGGGWS